MTFTLVLGFLGIVIKRHQRFANYGFSVIVEVEDYLKPIGRDL